MTRLPVTPTFANVAEVIREQHVDDLHGIADALGQHADDLDETLSEMTDKGLLFRWSDRGVTRYGVCRDRRVT